jgi:hypothetical protein
MATTDTYTVREAVLKSGYSAKHIRDLLWANRIVGARKIDGNWVIPAQAVKELCRRKEEHEVCA